MTHDFTTPPERSVQLITEARFAGRQEVSVRGVASIASSIEQPYVSLKVGRVLVYLERACDYFAISLLMPRNWMKRAYCEEGIQAVSELSLFGTSQTSVLRRLEDLGLIPRAEYNRAKGLVIHIQPTLDLGVAA